MVTLCRDWSTTAARKVGAAASSAASTAATVGGPAWGSPNTILGFGLGFTGSIVGTWAYRMGLTSEESYVDFGDGAMRFHNNPFILPGTALSLGHTHHYGPHSSPERWVRSYLEVLVRTGDHEAAHTVQSNLLGPFYLPVYGGAVIHSWLTGRHWHDNFMEMWTDDIALRQTR